MMIFFDLDGTLMDHKAAERAGALGFQSDHADLFPEPPDEFIERWHACSEKHMLRHFAGEISYRDQRRERLRELFAEHAELTAEKADELFLGYLTRYEEAWVLYPDVLPCLEALEDRPLGIISNGDGTQQRKKLDALGIAGRFSAVILSGEVGVSKPDRGIFAAACEEAGREPQECVYVGDSLESDARGSSRAGLRAIWLNRYGEGGGEEFTTIVSLAELGKVLP